MNACLNATSAMLLILAWVFIRRGMVRAHAYCITAALASSAAFLTSYLYYHFVLHGRTPFGGSGIVRTIYYSILLTHTVLAMVIVPLIVMALVHAARRHWDKHRRLARWTMPLWLYVSVTGVLVYWMLYQMPPVLR
ncbi:MAG: DUF420 domain-containing protein [Candidatus Sumerlaeaceae bacterium]